MNVALPSTAADLSLDRTGPTWVVTAYALAFGGLLLPAGRPDMSDGRSRTERR